MTPEIISKINTSLEITKKAIIGLGCSFVEGQGAYDLELYTNYKWEHTCNHESIRFLISEQEIEEIITLYPTVQRGFLRSLNLTTMEHANSFTHVLCNKYFNGEYTPINFGLRGKGNRASIKELTLTPDLNWDLAEEIIVIYCPSGLERFDFCSDMEFNGNSYITMWPHADILEGKPSRDMLWTCYKQLLWSEKSGVIEQIANAQELVTWCKLRNAKLIITPGFDRRYDPITFNIALQHEINRDVEGNITNDKSPSFFELQDTPQHRLVPLFPWDKMFKPNGYTTFADLAMAQEPDLTDRVDHYFQFMHIGSKNGWITPCAHPGANAHDLFAKYLYEHIKTL